MRSSSPSIAVTGRRSKALMPLWALAAAAALPFLPAPAWAWTALKLFLQF